ncbi:MAG: lysophospholipid acyltransferase family protein [bacterium]
MKKRLLNELSLLAAPTLGSLFIRILGRTWRYTTVKREQAERRRVRGKGLIYALWHGRMLPLIYMYRDRRVHVLVSRHRDGELATRIVERVGYGAVRGSSTSGGARGFQDLLNKVTSGFDVAITPDGPQGPPCKVQPGVLRLAQLSKSPIIPITHGASNPTTLKSWDGFMIPKPFSRCVVVYGDPIFVPPDASSALLEEKRAELERSLNRISEQADSFFD